MRTAVEPQWTPRQREVLDLLVCGNTNSEIAARLGISLDGAKWHVSEIITRLGVDSRDEAAEYWRHHNGMRMRFSRVMAGLFSSGALKWSAATVLVTGVVAASAIAIIALRENAGDEAEPSAGEPPAQATPDVTQPATNPQPTAVVTPQPTGETIAGVPVSSISFTQPGSLPVDGLSLIIEKGCYQCDAPGESFERVSLNSSGALQVEPLFEPTNGYLFSSHFDPAGRAYYVSVCTRGYCGGIAQLSDDAQTTLHRSTDGGVTWQELGVFDGPVGVATITTQGPLLNRSTFEDGETNYEFQVLGTQNIIRPPAGYGLAYSYTTGRAIGWQKEGGREVLNFDGSQLVTLPDVGLAPNRLASMEIIAVSPTGDILIAWVNGPDQGEQHRYIGILKGGKLNSILKADGSLTINTWLTQSIAFGNVLVSPTDVDPASSDSSGKLHPMMIDLQTGTITPLELYGPAFSSAYDFQRNRIVEVQPGPFLRVTGAGDCLNVRERPEADAPVVQCFADNVLLRDLAAEEQSGGIAWKKVATPGGEEGWASAEFLR